MMTCCQSRSGGLARHNPVNPFRTALELFDNSEQSSQAAFRGVITTTGASDGLALFLEGPIDRRVPRSLYREAWDLAHQLGWAKTYDAEFVGLARLLNCALLTKDARLKRRTSQLIEVIGPADL